MLLVKQGKNWKHKEILVSQENLSHWVQSAESSAVGLGLKLLKLGFPSWIGSLLGRMVGLGVCWVEWLDLGFVV